MNTPDIEIYVKNANADTILTWLKSHFNHVEVNITDEHINKGKSLSGVLTGGCSEDKIKVVITPHAAGKSFTSIWFQSDKTGWENDEECAMSLVQSFDLEVRCAASSWQESEEENSEQWWLITKQDKKLICW